MEKRVCVGCKNEFTTKYRQKRYCTIKCRESFRGNEKSCSQCGKSFIGREERIFCSSRCFGLFHRVRIIDYNLRNKKYPSIEGLTRQQIYWRYNSESREKILNRDRKKREDLIFFLGNKCVTCGYKENIRALELDHIKSDGYQDRKLKGSKVYRYYIKNLNEAKENLQVLCSNCNKIKAIEKNEHSITKRTKSMILKIPERI